MGRHAFPLIRTRFSEVASQEDQHYAEQVEALKARYFLYRWLLQFFLWMSRLSPGVRGGLIVGAYVLVRVLRDVARQLAWVLAPALDERRLQPGSSPGDRQALGEGDAGWR